MTKFEPHFFDGKWLCPCKDTYGSKAVLRTGWRSPDTDVQDSKEISNYVCDQNGDRWQQITTTDGALSWHYLGRPVKA